MHEPPQVHGAFYAHTVSPLKCVQPSMSTPQLPPLHTVFSIHRGLLRYSHLHEHHSPSCAHSLLLIHPTTLWIHTASMSTPHVPSGTHSFLHAHHKLLQVASLLSPEIFCVYLAICVHTAGVPPCVPSSGHTTGPLKYTQSCVHTSVPSGAHSLPRPHHRFPLILPPSWS